MNINKTIGKIINKVKLKPRKKHDDPFYALKQKINRWNK